jgi:hypothetical protein
LALACSAFAVRAALSFSQRRAPLGVEEKQLHHFGWLDWFETVTQRSS